VIEFDKVVAVLRAIVAGELENFYKATTGSGKVVGEFVNSELRKLGLSAGGELATFLQEREWVGLPEQPWVRRAEQRSPLSTDLDNMALFSRLSPSYRTALAYALEMSGFENPQNRIHMPHLVIGLLQEPNGPARRLFARHAIGDNELLHLLQRASGPPLRVLPGGHRPPELLSPPPMSPHVQEALSAALASADDKGSELIGSNHLLYGALSVDSAVTTQLLNERGIRKEEIALEEPRWIAGYQSDQTTGPDLLGVER
jgi:hypothetical protein